MALKIRLRQQGRKNRQTFRLVVTDIRYPRDGKYLEMLGSYDPHRAQNNMQLNTERLTYWLGQGAQLSERAQRLLQSIAPAITKDVKAKQHAARLKKIKQRRALKTKDRKVATAPAKEKVAAESTPKKRRVAAKKAKTKDEN
jgi:small subunit ribosomal protein S16